MGNRLKTRAWGSGSQLANVRRNELLAMNVGCDSPPAALASVPEIGASASPAQHEPAAPRAVVGQTAAGSARGVTCAASAPADKNELVEWRRPLNGDSALSHEGALQPLQSDVRGYAAARHSHDYDSYNGVARHAGRESPAEERPGGRGRGRQAAPEVQSANGALCTAESASDWRHPAAAAVPAPECARSDGAGSFELKHDECVPPANICACQSSAQSRSHGHRRAIKAAGRMSQS